VHSLVLQGINFIHELQKNLLKLKLTHHPLVASSVFKYTMFIIRVTKTLDLKHFLVYIMHTLSI
jgi:hypothetical protein